MTPYYDDGTCTIYHGDCRDVLPGVATSPPYRDVLGRKLARNRRFVLVVEHGGVVGAWGRSIPVVPSPQAFPTTYLATAVYTLDRR